MNRGRRELVNMSTRGVIRNILWWDGKTFNWIIHEEPYASRTLHKMLEMSSLRGGLWGSGRRECKEGLPVVWAQKIV